MLRNKNILAFSRMPECRGCGVDFEKKKKPALGEADLKKTN
jgi:hypothetical protein